MSVWWYAAGGQRLGPVDEAELKRLLQRNVVLVDTLVWGEGLESWLPLRDVQQLRHLLSGLPPPLPMEPHPRAQSPAVEADRREMTAAPALLSEPKTASPQLQESAAQVPAEELPLATRWPRFFARTFDIWVLSLLIVPVALLLLWMTSKSNLIHSTRLPLLGLALLPVVMGMDALVYRLFGNTPGKAFLGLRVERHNGERLSIAQYCGRNVGVWMSGLALGLPIASFASLLYQSAHVKRTGISTYDDGSEYRVHQHPAGMLRKLVFTALFIILFTTNAVLIGLGNRAQTAIAQDSRASPTEPSARHEVATAAPVIAANPDNTGALAVKSDKCTSLFSNGQMPVARNPKLMEHATYLCYEGYVSMYSGLTMTPLWSAKHITSNSIGAPVDHPYPSTFRADDRIPLAERNGKVDFNTVGYDGVLLTSPDDLGTETGRIQSFTYANAVLAESTRAQKVFQYVQESLRRSARNGADYYIVTGALFEGNKLVQSNDRMIIPSGLYLAAYRPGATSALAIVIDNNAQAEVYSVTLEELERRAMFNLFPALPDKVKRLALDGTTNRQRLTAEP